MLDLKPRRTFSGVFVVASFYAVRCNAASTDELAGPDLLHVQSTDLMLFTTTVRTLHKPTTHTLASLDLHISASLIHASYLSVSEMNLMTKCHTNRRYFTTQAHQQQGLLKQPPNAQPR